MVYIWWSRGATQVLLNSSDCGNYTGEKKTLHYFHWPRLSSHFTEIDTIHLKLDSNHKNISKYTQLQLLMKSEDCCSILLGICGTNTTYFSVQKYVQIRNSCILSLFDLPRPMSRRKLWYRVNKRTLQTVIRVYPDDQRNLLYFPWKHSARADLIIFLSLTAQ